MNENNMQDVNPENIEQTDSADLQNMTFTLGFGAAPGLCRRGVSRSTHQ